MNERRQTNLVFCNGRRKKKSSLETAKTRKDLLSVSDLLQKLCLNSEGYECSTICRRRRSVRDNGSSARSMNVGESVLISMRNLHES